MRKVTGREKTLGTTRKLDLSPNWAKVKGIFASFPEIPGEIRFSFFFSIDRDTLAQDLPVLLVYSGRIKGRANLKRTILHFLLVSLLFPAISSADGTYQVLRLSDRQRVSLESIVGELKDARLVFVGELHDQAAHHDVQLAIIRALTETGSQVAVGLEMFRKESQDSLDKWVNGRLSEAAFKDIYYDNWTLPWSLYRDIFVYAQEKALPLVGLNVPPEVTKQVSRQGFASLTDEQLERLPQVSCNIDETYMKFVRRVFGAHVHSGTEFVYFCEAQVVWDTAMAHYALDFLNEHPETTMVVLAGSGHAWRRGIPEQIRRRSEASYKIILPSIPGKTDSETATTEDADYIWLPES